ncbi:PIN domain-containing protein [Streptomyces sp. AV19]|uniref:type II toxin-antitoxin system VapC family toxin n=1 Tax=Streptomyces sp. AV19 TaxID=2793068 RepID=UPI0018FE050D|nr:PIN domain-containing protein [Streptomyces sp. AV19]MBH1936035.1 PIN domain-containing protein [Streptomyces sp. AV19]MDG4534173.1 PIN domain-containing protein [Streptomyces sp. AV19]
MTGQTRLAAVADASVLLGVFNRKDDRHDDAVAALGAARILIVSPLVLDELDHLLIHRVGEDAALHAVATIGALASQSRIRLPVIDRSLLGEAHDLLRRYRGHALGLTDAVNACLAWRLDSPCILSFDGHYSHTIAPRTAVERGLEVIPDPYG